MPYSDQDSDSDSDSDCDHVCDDCGRCKYHSCTCEGVSKLHNIVQSQIKSFNEASAELIGSDKRPISKFGKAMMQCQRDQRKQLAKTLASFTVEQTKQLGPRSFFNIVMLASSPHTVRIIFEWYGVQKIRTQLKGEAIIASAVMIKKSIPFLCQLIMYGCDLLEKEEQTGLDVFDLVDQIGDATQKLLFAYVMKHFERYRKLSVMN